MAYEVAYKMPTECTAPKYFLLGTSMAHSSGRDPFYTIYRCSPTDLRRNLDSSPFVFKPSGFHQAGTDTPLHHNRGLLPVVMRPGKDTPRTILGGEGSCPW